MTELRAPGAGTGVSKPQRETLEQLGGEEPAEDSSDDLVLRVRTASGRPAVGLEWNIVPAGDDPVRGRGAMIVDALGTLRVPAGTIRERRLRSGGQYELELAALLFASESPRIALPELTVGGPPDVRVPDFGSIEVQVVDGDGRAQTASQSLVVQLRDAGRGERFEALDPAQRSAWPRTDDGGRVKLPAVALGRRFWISSDATTESAVEVDGPVRDAERVRVDVPGRDRLPELRVTVVDGAGAVLPELALEVKLYGLMPDGGDSWRIQTDRVTTDDRGRLSWTPGRTRGGLSLHWLELGEYRSGDRRAAVRLPQELEGLEVLELGEVRLGVPELLAAGVVMDGFGQPEAETEVGLVRLSRPLGVPMLPMEEFEARRRAGTADEPLLLDDFVEDSESDAGGNFELRGQRFLEGEHYAQRVEPESGNAFYYGVELGTTDLRLVGPAVRGLKLEVLADWDQLPWGALLLQLDKEPGGWIQRELTAQAPRLQFALDDARISGGALIAGGVEVHEFGEIDWLEGGLTDLGTVDLREAIDTFAIRVLEQDGRPARRASVFRGTSEGGFTLVGGAQYDMELYSCLRGFGEGPWSVFAPGSQIARVDVLEDGATVQLEPACALRLELAGSAEGFRPQLVFERPLPGSWSQPVRPEAVADGFEASLPAAGRWTLEWHPDGADPRRTPHVSSEVLAVPEQGGVLTVRAPGE